MHNQTSNLHMLPVIGKPGSLFYVIHIVALLSLSVSVLVSIGVLVYLFVSNPKMGLWKLNLGERLVVYLAICDLLYSVSHMFDHSYMLALGGHPPDPQCQAFAWLLQEFYFAQSIVITFMAVNAFLMVVKSKRISLGKYDWKLILFAVGTPTVIGAIGLSIGFFGPTGAWCLVDMRLSFGPMVNNIFAFCQILVAVVNFTCYTMVWAKLRKVPNIAGLGGNPKLKRNKYRKTAKVMMLFIVAYFAQYWPFMVYAAWSPFSTPHPLIVICIVTFCNMGGVFNFLTYTFIRKKSQSVGNQEESASISLAH